MIAVRIPKEIRAYKEKLVMGLTLRQMIATILALGICIPLYIFGKEVINEEILSWMIIAVALPLAGLGYFKYNGLVFEKFVTVIFKQAFLYPAKRKFKQENCFRQWQEGTEKEEAAKQGKNSKKAKRLALQASLERSVLIEEAKERGEVVDAKDLDEKLLTVRTGGGKLPEDKDKKMKQKKQIKKQSAAKSKLDLQAEAIKEKQAKDPYYLINRKERAILIKWGRAQEKARLAELQKKKKVVSQKNKKMVKRRSLSTTIPRTVQQTIPYIADYEEGLFEVEPNKYSKCYAFDDLNYLTSNEDEQVGFFRKYGEFINYFSEEMNIAIIIDNRVVSMNEQERKVFYQHTGDSYDPHRSEFNRVLRRQIVAGRNDIQQKKYITVTIDCDSPYEAILRFHKIDAEVTVNFKKIGVPNVEVMSTDERLEMLHDKFRKGREGEFKINYNFIKEQGISSKDYIAPSSFDFSSKKDFMIEDEYYRCLYLSNLPASLSDDFLADLVDCEFPLVTSLSVQPVAQDKALRLVKKQLTGMEANKIEAEKKAVRAGYSPETISHDLKQSLAQGEELLDDMMNKNQKMFFLTITLMVNGRTREELEENVKILTSKARMYTCQLQRFDWQQEDAFKLTLPMGYNPKHLSVERALTTESTSIFIPFASQELFQEGGFYYGLNQISRNLILCNRTSMKTPSGFILGSSGSGKSFATKREILNVLLNDGKTGVLVIDPENEYGDFARAFGGTVIKISADSKNYINPMDMPREYGLDEDDGEDTPLETLKEKAIKKKSDYIMSIVERMISTGGDHASTITPQQKTIVDRCVYKCYEQYLNNDFDEQYLPTLIQLQDELDKEKATSEDGRQMAEGVEYYTRGSMDIFAHKTNVGVNNRFVVFNVRDLGDQLRQIALIIMFDFIWNRMIDNKNKGVRTYCYCDEIHVMFATYYSAYFLKQLYKRGRKYGLVITGITQNLEDLLKSEMARGMVGNSDFIMMLNQAPEDLRVLAGMLNISPTQMQFVCRVDAGSGLLFAEKTIVPFIDQFPKDSYLYTLMSTKFGENEDVSRFVQKEMEKNTVEVPLTAEEVDALYNQKEAEKVEIGA